MSPHNESLNIAPVEEILAEMRAGRMVVLVDDEDRENEGDIILAAEHVTPEAINFMAKHARGLICLTITEARAQQIGLLPMARDNKSPFNTAFTVSIEAASGVTTGISAQDRARTVQAAVAPHAKPEDVVQPGHIFPITARDGGVLVRAGHTEAGCDLARMAGLDPSSVICEVLNDDGTMARLPDLMKFAHEHGLKIGTIADLIHFRSQHETLVERSLSKKVRSACGQFELTLYAYTDRSSGEVHLALAKGDISPEKETLVRVHEPLSVLDFLDPTAGQHTFSLAQAQQALHKAESGVIVLLRRAESEQDMLSALTQQSVPSHDAQATQQKWDPRMYGIGAQILRDLGVRKMKLMASPRKMPSMTGFDLEITTHISSPAEL